MSGREWGGCFTQAEIIALINNEAIPHKHDKYKVDMVKEEIKKGECNRTWFYFQISGELKRQIGEINKKER